MRTAALTHLSGMMVYHLTTGTMGEGFWKSIERALNVSVVLSREQGRGAMNHAEKNIVAWRRRRGAKNHADCNC